jgi:tripartite-type tricarboxylate transporter receptor subunit TctC
MLKSVFVAVAFAALAAPWHANAQDAYPTRPLRIVVPSGSGSGSDILARMIAQRLTERLGKQVIIENRTGAGNMIGYEFAARSAPDGYTLVSGVSTLAINPATYKKVPYDALRDFEPISHTANVPNLLVTHPALPVQNLRDLIALARSRPGELLYASAGHGTNPHLTIELLGSMAQLRFVHVPYKSGPPGLTDLMAGQVQLMATAMNYLRPHALAGRLRALGVTTARRAVSMPDMPTLAESGLPGYESVQWYSMLAPAKTPRPIIERLNREIVTYLRLPDVVEKMTADGNEIVAGTPEEFAAFLRAETVKWAKVARAAGIKPE